jgi:hypothetical protein
MTICNDFAYHLIELLGLPDAENSIILKAQITSIDRTANTANVSYLTTSAVSLSGTAVPFWFHCEFSAGTLADLEYGHLSFKVDDVVYVVHFPAIGTDPNDIEARTYIVGHADMQFTRTCINEILEITQDDYVTLVDIGRREIFDIDGFNTRLGIDPAVSPVSPPEYSCERDGQVTQCRLPTYNNTVYEAWRNTYFESVEDIPKSVNDSGFLRGAIGYIGGTAVQEGEWSTPPSEWVSGTGFANTLQHNYAGTVTVTGETPFRTEDIDYYVGNVVDHAEESESTGYQYGVGMYWWKVPEKSFHGVYDSYFPAFRGMVEIATGKFFGIGVAGEQEESAWMESGYITVPHSYTHQITTSLRVFRTGIFDDVVLEDGKRDSVILWEDEFDYDLEFDGESYTLSGVSHLLYSTSESPAIDFPTFYEWDREAKSPTNHEIVGRFGVYYLYGLVGEINSYDLEDMDLNSENRDITEYWTEWEDAVHDFQVGDGLVRPPAIFPQAGAVDHATPLIIPAPYSVFAPLKEVGTAIPIPLENCIAAANKEVCMIIDLAIIYLTKHVFINKGLGDGESGARVHPSLAVYAIKDQYI